MYKCLPFGAKEVSAGWGHGEKPGCCTGQESKVEDHTPWSGDLAAFGIVSRGLALDSLGLCAKKSSVLGRVANSKGWFSILGAERLTHWPSDGQSQAASTTGWPRRVRRDQLRLEKLTMPQNSPSDTLTHRYTDIHTRHPHGCPHSHCESLHRPTI